MLNDLLLLSGNDIPFTAAELTLHVPTIKEIGLIGEEMFFTGLQFLNFSKANLLDADNIDSQQYTDFQILMSIAASQDLNMRQSKIAAEMVLTLLFPEHTIHFLPIAIALTKEGTNHLINQDNFDEFKQILTQVFCLQDIFGNNTPRTYNPGNAVAERLAKQFERYHKKINEIKGSQKGGQKVSILSRYISILAVGEQKDINSLLNYTIYQLFDEFNRFNLKQQSDMYIQAKMAGAKDLQEVENWMKDIHSDSND